MYNVVCMRSAGEVSENTEEKEGDERLTKGEGGKEDRATRTLHCVRLATSQ